MPMEIEGAIKIEKADPDSHFRLLPCPNCGSDNVAYVQYMIGIQEPWKVRCFDCGHAVDKQAIFKHEAKRYWDRVCQDRKDKPCLNCPDRHTACSDHCQKPEKIAWDEKQARIRENRKKYECPIWKHGDRDSRKR